MRRAADGAKRNRAPSSKPGRLQRRVVTLASANTELPGMRANDFDLDLPPGSVGLLVGGKVANRVLRVDLANDLFIDTIQLAHLRGEEGQASSRLRNLAQDRPLLGANRLGLMLEGTDGVHGRVRGLERSHQVAEPEAAACVGAVGVQHHDLSTVLFPGGVEIDPDRIVERRLPSGLQPPDALEEAGEIVLRIAAAPYVAR